MTMTGGRGPMRLPLDAVKRHKLRPGTFRRAVPYATRYRGLLALLLIMTALHAGIVAMGPIILKFIIDDGLIPGRFAVIVTLSLLLVGLALVDAAAIYGQIWLSARVGQGLLLSAA